MDELKDAQLLYEIINDFITETKIPIVELFGIFEIIKVEQGQYLVNDIDEGLN
jgi:hypothetical protein